MAVKVVSLSLQESTIKQIDELAEKMGVSRSTFVEMTMKTAVGGQNLSDFTKWLFSQRKEEENDDKGFVTV